MEHRYMELETPSFIAQASPALCRVCANNHEYIIHLYSDDNHGLVEKINKHLPIKISEADSLPCEVCYQCASTVLAFSDLIDTCLIAQKRLVSMLSYQGEVVERRQGNSENCSKDKGVFISTRENGIEHDSRNLDAQSHRNRDKAMEPADPFQDLEEDGDDSNIGGDEFGDDTAEPASARGRKKKRKQAKMSKCPICGKVCMYLNAHLVSHSDTRPHKCRICNTAFKRKDHVNYHRKTVHMRHPEVLQELKDKGEQYLTCEQCGEVRATKYSMAIHLKTHAVSSQCEVCGENFNVLSSLREHMIKIHSKIHLPCSICGEEILSGKELYHHKQKHFSSFICDVCGKRFAKQSSLTTHMVVHSDERPYSCGECGKAFKLKIRLQIHKKSHKNLRPYECGICKEKKFKTKYALAVHYNMHNDVRAYPCPHCPFKARKHYDLVCHVRTHTGEKPYKCEICGRGFAQAGDMRKHRSTHDRHKLDPNKV